nr:LacI family DNA-binding transcriptional regulator [Plantibacter sp. VKM Ac-2880]
MRDVAAHAGVSAKTVSRVFRNEQHVSESVRERVNISMRELHFVPNMLARTFREGRAAMIGVAIPNLSDSFFASVVEAVDEVAKTHGHTIAVTNLGSDPEHERSVVEGLLRTQIDALIIAPTSDDQRYLEAWSSRTPIVVIDREPTGLVTDVFLENDRRGGELAVHHLFELGHRRIAFLGADDAVATTTQRLLGFCTARDDLGLPTDERLVAFAGPGEAGGALSGLLELSDPPTALFSSNARTSVELIPALQRLDRDDLALVSFGDFPMADLLRPSISVIDQNPGRLGRAATERALLRVADPDGDYELRTVYDVGLIVRGSSVAPPTPTTT